MRNFAPPLLWLLVPGLSLAGGRTTVGADAIWQPGEQFLVEVHKACDSAAKFGDCFVEQMARVAPPAAVAFTRSIHNEGWMRDFRHAGQVDIAFVEYPFRANDNQSWLLVNGSPPVVEPDDVRKLQGQLKADMAGSRKSGASPKAALFPGERVNTPGPVAILYPDGSEEFLVDYKVMDGCRACAVLGRVFFSFEFNSKGKSVSARMVGEDSDQTWPIRTHTGQRFTISLGCNSRMGFDWAEEQPPADSILRSAGKRDDPEAGVQLWNYEVVGAGTTQMALRYASPNAPDRAMSLVVRVIAAPGLRR